MTAFPRAPVAALAVALAVGLPACGGDENPTIEGPATSVTPTSATTGGSPPPTAAGTSPAPTAAASANAFTITVQGGSVEGPSRARVKLNQTVVLRVTSDTEDEVHVHGYDKTAPVGPGRVAEISFPANIPGTFEVELEKAHRRITTLEVQP
ncbi:MAG: hypothetical protein M3314_07450 [Actinomycetota bacterium]|nr:hypothetical protein [Actinomycetota bacterium]